MIRVLLVSVLLAAAPLQGAVRLAPELRQLYEDLHRYPELSFQERNTAKRLAQELRKAGVKVSEGIGGFGVVGILENGPGPVLLLRADSDALPVREETGLPFASQVTQLDGSGRKVPVMHACGHDVHMTVLVGTVLALQKQRYLWQGTLVLVVQPAEERGQGALQMLRDGLFEKFPRPAYNLALHVAADMPTGTVGYTPGYAFANVDTVDITLFGEGGHGAAPHKAKDPIVLAAQLVLALQTIVSREVAPNESAVVTVGSIQSGTQHNVIPQEATLQLTVRSYGPEVRAQILSAIQRISKGLASAAGTAEPRVSILETYTPSVYNDPALSERAAGTLAKSLGSDRVQKIPPVMVGEDFGRYGLVEPRIPSLIFWLGSIENSQFQEALAGKRKLPTLHASQYRPDPDPTIDTGIRAMTALVNDLLAPTGAR